MTEQKELLPCQPCGVVLTRQGDYTNTEAWNWYGHPNAEDSPCLLARHRIPTLSDLHTPSPAEAARWNVRAQPAEDEQVKEIWNRCRDNFRELGNDEWRSQYAADIRYLLSLLPVQPAQQDGISWSALLASLERLRSKNRNPANEWYHGWNAAIQCLINDINARSVSASRVEKREQDFLDSV